MPFHRDEAFAARFDEVERFYYGEYLTTYTSPNNQVEAYLFRKSNGKVQARVRDLIRFNNFREVTDRFVTELQAYAQEHGFADRFELILTGP